MDVFLCALRVVALSLGALSCQSQVKPDDKEALTKPSSIQAPLVKYVSTYGPDAVLWADENGMYVSDAEGNLKEKISDKGADWCALDHRTGLLWFERGDAL